MNPSRLQIALHAGEVGHHDAVSRSLVGTLRLLRHLAGRGAPVEVTALVASTDCDEPGIQVVPRTWDRLTAPSFRRADVHVWEYATWYEGFDVVFVTRPAALNVAICHGVAASDVPPPLLQRTLVRRHTLSRMHHVACDGEGSRADLIELGLDPARLSVVPAPVEGDGGHSGLLRALEAAMATAAVDVPRWVREGAA